MTHGAVDSGVVRWSPGAHRCGLLNGPGVGTSVEAGPRTGGWGDHPSLAVPRRMIVHAIEENRGEPPPHARSRRDILSAERGGDRPEDAQPRLGVVGGISISRRRESFSRIRPMHGGRAWIKAIDVVVATDCEGSCSRREAAAIDGRGPLPRPARTGFIETNVFTGTRSNAALVEASNGSPVCGMVGKFAKIAQGHFQTHVAGNTVTCASSPGRGGMWRTIRDRS